MSDATQRIRDFLQVLQNCAFDRAEVPDDHVLVTTGAATALTVGDLRGLLQLSPASAAPASSPLSSFAQWWEAQDKSAFKGAGYRDTAEERGVVHSWCKAAWEANAPSSSIAATLPYDEAVVDELTGLAYDKSDEKFRREAYITAHRLARRFEHEVKTLRSAIQAHDDGQQRLLDELLARDDRLEAMVRRAVETSDLTELSEWLKIRVGVRFITDTAFGGD